MGATDLVNEPVIYHSAADLLEELVQRFDLAHANCKQKGRPPNATGNYIITQ
jgi:hypothetical protein